MARYIDADKLIAEIERFSATEYDGNTLGDDVANSALDFVIKEIIPSLQQEPPEDTDTLRAKLVNFLIRNHIQENEAKYLADRISDTYGAQRYLDGLCDAANADEQEEQSEVDWDFSMFAKEMDVVFNLPEEVTKNTEENPLNWEYAIARHFYELGLKAKK